MVCSLYKSSVMIISLSEVTCKFSEAVMCVAVQNVRK